MKKAILAAAIIFLSIFSCKKAENPVSANWELRGKIVYATWQPEVHESGIYVLDLGSPDPLPRLLVAQADDPVVSPDGRVVAFSKISPAWSSDIYTINIDGTAMRDLTNRAGVREVFPDWSPDGEKIVFEGYTPGLPTQLYTMNADGSNIRALTDTSQVADCARWSPDGKWIAFLTRPDWYRTPPSLDIIWPDGSHQTKLDSPVANINNIRWSPSSQKLAYWGYGGGDFYVDLARMRISQIGDLPDSVFNYYAWAPGDKLVCAAHARTVAPFLHSVYLVDSGDPSKRVRIAEGFSRLDAYGLVASPNGAYIGMFAERPEDEGLFFYLAAADGGHLQKVALITQQRGVYVLCSQWVE